MSEVVDWPLGERPDVERSGARVFLDAVGVVDAQVEHAARLQAAVDEIRALACAWADQPTDCDEDTEQQIQDGRHIRAVLDKHLAAAVVAQHGVAEC